MFVELHILQNFAPSCLNRDESNSPKDCEFGGFRRARISSQCIKRAVRNYFDKDALLPGENLARRTKLVVDETAKRLEKKGKEREQAKAVAQAALAGAGLATGDDGTTQYLLFLGHNELDAFASLCLDHWDTLAALLARKPSEEAKGARKAKKEAKQEFPADLKKRVLRLLDGGKAADLALFGRMLADLPDKNIDAACQVAHAISTNKVGVEFDFYTAVDDLQPREQTGAGMMGTIEFNSACYYRYANIDLRQLNENLRGDQELARKTVEAFIRAAVAAVPSGKQNSMAAHNPPSFVLAVVRRSALWSLANAFVKPVQPRHDRDLMAGSFEALKTYWEKLCKAYGDNGIDGKWAVCLDGPTAPFEDAASVEKLVQQVNAKLDFS